jgi:hypothetical protein
MHHLVCTKCCYQPSNNAQPNLTLPACHTTHVTDFGTAKGDNTAQGAAAPNDRPAVYAEALKTGEAQTNAPCPTGELPCY